MCASLLFWQHPVFAYSPVHFRSVSTVEKYFFGILSGLGLALFVIIKVLRKTGH
ncbi:MAG: hypothetical protein NTY45_10820 [Elusimicrobia bacterium]|nr:hypothetical protein [Elusimicrobiota bacterium]